MERTYVIIPKDQLTLRWVCQVVRSGYHNGAQCSPGEPHDHDYWGCEWRMELSISREECRSYATMKVKGEQS